VRSLTAKKEVCGQRTSALFIRSKRWLLACHQAASEFFVGDLVVLDQLVSGKVTDVT